MNSQKKYNKNGKRAAKKAPIEKSYNWHYLFIGKMPIEYVYKIAKVTPSTSQGEKVA